MSSPRNLYPDTTLYVTVRAVHRSYRLVPRKRVNRVLEFAFAAVSSKHREKWGMEFYEFLSTHYHIVLFDRFGRVSDFLQDFNAVVARELNALRGKGGKFFADGPGIQTVLGDERVLEHCVYTLANAVAAGIVHKAAHWKGLNSLRMPYGKQYVISKPRIGIWSKKQQHKHRRRSQRSGRAAFADRSKMPETAVLMIDRPRIMPELSDEELRAKVREGLKKREAKIQVERAGKPVLGMKAALRVHWSTVPTKGAELFGRQPTFSTQTREQRSRMRGLRGRFLRDYRLALARWNAGERDVVFPAGTVRMRLRHEVLTEPIPLDLLLVA
ncbi:MAG: hypothetical protein ACRBN8_02185 [Nannocystales bacterium]